MIKVRLIVKYSSQEVCAYELKVTCLKTYFWIKHRNKLKNK